MKGADVELTGQAKTVHPAIAAVVLAAGESKRMGRPKMVLPWGNTTVIGQVVRMLHQAGVGDIVVVTGGARREVEAALQGLPGRPVYNSHYMGEEMVFSLQAGLSVLSEDIQASLVVLGDQPQIEARVVQAVITAYQELQVPLVVPSFDMRRGHPWLVARTLWPAILDLQPGGTLRDVLNAHAPLIHYLPVETASVLRDIDTPEEYQRECPPTG